jgi:hypothetical protein
MGAINLHLEVGKMRVRIGRQGPSDMGRNSIQELHRNLAGYAIITMPMVKELGPLQIVHRKFVGTTGPSSKCEFACRNQPAI